MNKIICFLLVFFVFFLKTGHAQDKFVAEGKASFYGAKFHGRATASGEIFNMHHLTAAHPHLPFNSMVKVTNKQNNKSVVVRINDRGPFNSSRIIDLSRAAAEKLGIVEKGVAVVKLELIPF